MVIASDQTAARAYAAALTKLTVKTPTVVLSDDPGSSARIAEYSGGNEPWLVAVRMVSEGVDVPRLAVGVYATSASTPLFFARRSADSSGPAGPAKRRASSCRRCPTCC